MKSMIKAGAVAIAIVSVSHPAMAANILKNGSFEEGLADWTIGGVTNDGYLPAAIYYNSTASYPDGAQGEAIPPDSATSLSPDAAGDRAAYFVTDDAINQSLNQTVYLTAGSYSIGFDTYAPFNGYNEPNDATFTGEIAGVKLANFSVSSVSPQEWTNYSGTALIKTAGYYEASFVFNPTMFPAKDVVVDKAYIVGIAGGGGTPISAVPELETWAMMIAGFGAIGGVMRRAYRNSEDNLTVKAQSLATA